MAVVLLGVLPLMVAGSFAQMRALRTNTDKSQQSIAQAGGVAVQAITGIRTVTAFNMSPKLLALYSAALRKPMLLGIRNALLRGLTLGLSQFVTLGAYGLLFWYGTTLVLDAPPEDRGRAFQRMLRSLMAVTMSAQGIGQNTSFLGDQAAANSAAARIFAVVDRRPAIDSTGEGGEALAKVEGKVEFRQVDFTYPARPEQRIFRRFNLTVGGFLVVGSGSPYISIGPLIVHGHTYKHPHKHHNRARHDGGAGGRERVGQEHGRLAGGAFL